MNNWDAHHYDGKLGYVSEFGKDVVSLLLPKKGERILDLGCGTGDLSYEIARSGATVLGIDLADTMIEEARAKYPHIHFAVENGENFRIAEQFDAVLSNAALHWMKKPSGVIESVWRALKPGGRFVAEFGGKGNVETIINALDSALRRIDASAESRNPWFFPSLGEYASLLEKQGFRVIYAVHFDRPTKLEDGERGLDHWLTAFAGHYFHGLHEAQRMQAIQEVKHAVRPKLFHDNSWFADYKRLRIVARRPQLRAENVNR